METSQKIHLNHLQVLQACFELAKKSGFKPRDLSCMEIERGPDLVFHSGESRVQYQLAFDCDEPTGRWCWDRHGRVMPSMLSSEATLPALSVESGDGGALEGV